MLVLCRFLKHVERTRLLLFVVDVQGFRLNTNSETRTAFQTCALLNRELELYRRDLVDKPAVCLVNKMDTENAEAKLKSLRSSLGEAYEESLLELPEEMRPQRRILFDDVIPMSAKFSRPSVASVKSALRQWIDHHEARKVEDSDTSVALLEEQFKEANLTKGPTFI